MTMQTITTANDLRTWIANNNPVNICGGENVEERRMRTERLAEMMRDADDRPAWGSDMEEWLDVAAEELALTIVGAPIAFAALGTDGRDPVVWGMGRTEAGARRDVRLSNDDSDAIEIAHVVAITAERAARIEGGDVAASDLWPVKAA
jgi:hypothetical protein